MSEVAVIYFSGTGTTRTAAEHVVKGCGKVDGINVTLLEIVGEDIDQGRWQNDDLAAQLDAADAIIFGSPTYMGAVSGQMKCFMDAMAPRWYTAAWRDKIGAAFTVSSLAAGDKLNALTDFVTFGMQMGLIWCGTGGSFGDGVNAHGFYLGAGLQSGPDGFTEIDIATAEFLGERVGHLVTRIG